MKKAAKISSVCIFKEVTMRYSFGFSSPTPNVTRFLIILIATYLFFAIFGHTRPGFFMYHTLSLEPRQAVYSFELWRVITYAFLHDSTSPLHVIFNALILYMVGTPLEERWGEKRFFIFIFVAILLGGACVCLSFLCGLTHASVVGFSAATIGPWGLTFSTQNIYVFGVLPLTGKQLVYVTVGLEIIYAVSSNKISSAAHFGGIIAGFIFTLGLYKPHRIKHMWKHRS
jgi:membrane associated rhomboid family serine protease